MPLINEFSREDGWESVWDRIDDYLALAGMPERTIPIAAERALARKEALEREREKQEAEARAALERRREHAAANGRYPPAPEPKWGTAETKRLEIERLRREIDERKKR